MKEHIKVSRAHRALAVLYGFIAAFWILVVIVAFDPHKVAESLAMLLVPALLIGIAALHRHAARGAFAKKTSARTLSKVMGAIMLLGFPIGTAVGIYLLINTQSWETETAPPNRPAAPGAWPPPPTSPQEEGL